MLTTLTSFATFGLSSERITVEVGTVPGEGGITIVGLGDAAVQESKQRVKLALRANGFKLPPSKTVTVNLAPADFKKIGPRYDLPIAVGLILVNKLIELPPEKLKRTALLGELALDGSLRHVTGVLSAAISCKDAGIDTLIVPSINGPEAALVPGLRVIAPESLKELIAILMDLKKPAPVKPPDTTVIPFAHAIDFADVRGQEHAKRALEIAAAGGHNVLMSGAPGSGKTLLASALRGILPPLTLEESLEVTQIYSVANLLPTDQPLISQRPFRTVHHTASGVSIVGGGQIPGPGEVSLAHRGVLFLDELAEFPSNVLEVLRQPLEDRRITITRAQGAVTFPADVLLIAAMNPPQWTGSPSLKVKRRLSAPFLDRIDLTIDVQPVPIDDLRQKAVPSGDPTATIAKRVLAARAMQQKRFKQCSISTNKEMGIRELREFCVLDNTSETILKQAAERLKLSARSYHRTIKVARTIADLQQSDRIESSHIAEALQYRQSIGIEH